MDKILGPAKCLVEQIENLGGDTSSFEEGLQKAADKIEEGWPHKAMRMAARIESDALAQRENLIRKNILQPLEEFKERLDWNEQTDRDDSDALALYTIARGHVDHGRYVEARGILIILEGLLLQNDEKEPPMSETSCSIERVRDLLSEMASIDMDVSQPRDLIERADRAMALGLPKKAEYLSSKAEVLLHQMVNDAITANAREVIARVEEEIQVARESGAETSLADSLIRYAKDAIESGRMDDLHDIIREAQEVVENVSERIGERDADAYSPEEWDDAVRTISEVLADLRALNVDTGSIESELGLAKRLFSYGDIKGAADVMKRCVRDVETAHHIIKAGGGVLADMVKPDIPGFCEVEDRVRPVKVLVPEVPTLDTSHLSTRSH